MAAVGADVEGCSEDAAAALAAVAAYEAEEIQGSGRAEADERHQDHRSELSMRSGRSARSGRSGRTERSGACQAIAEVNEAQAASSRANTEAGDGAPGVAERPRPVLRALADILAAVVCCRACSSGKVPQAISRNSGSKASGSSTDAASLGEEDLARTRGRTMMEMITKNRKTSNAQSDQRPSGPEGGGVLGCGLGDCEQKGEQGGEGVQVAPRNPSVPTTQSSHSLNVEYGIRDGGRPKGLGRSMSMVLRDRRRSQAQAESGLLVDATCEVMAPCILRQGEVFESDVVQELSKGSEVVIVAHGAGRRVQVCDIATGSVGWVSTQSSDGTKLLTLKYEAPGEGFCAGAISTVSEEWIKLRAGEDVKSEELGEVKKEEQLLILERRMGRRVQVNRLLNGQIGWVSITGQNSVKLLALQDEAPWRKKDFVLGATARSIRTVIIRAEEDTNSALLLEVPIGEDFTLVELGRGTRVKVRHHSSGTEGWVSTASRVGYFLLEVCEQALVVGDTLELPRDVVLRETQDMTSSVVEECAAGEQIEMLEVHAGSGVIKVKALARGPEGWVERRDLEKPRPKNSVPKLTLPQPSEDKLEIEGVAEGMPFLAPSEQSLPHKSEGGDDVVVGGSSVGADIAAPVATSEAGRSARASSQGPAKIDSSAQIEKKEQAKVKVAVQAAVGFTSAQANAALKCLDQINSGGGVPEGAREIPAGCLCCMFTKVRYVKMPA